VKYINFCTKFEDMIAIDSLGWIIVPIHKNHLVGWFAVNPDANDRLVCKELLRTGLSKMQSTIIIQMINHAKDWDDDDDPSINDLDAIHSVISTILQKKF